MTRVRFGSACSGIEAASVAWHPLGWEAAWFSEIESFPSEVLAHRYPDVPNLGDMTAIAKRVLTGEVEAPDVLAGGTPCQAFSVAGLRESLADERGNLTLKFVELADAIDFVRARHRRPAAIVVWENVHGVLSTKDNAFGCFLAGLAGEDEPLRAPGGKWANAGAVYGPARAVAWRTLDAQYFGVAQRRRRVFVVASARDGFDPAAVLFEWDGVRRDSPPSREAGEGAAAGTLRSTDGGSDVDHARAGHLAVVGAIGFQSSQSGVRLVDTHATLDANNGPRRHNGVITMAHGQGGAEIGFDRGPTLTCNHEAPIAAYSVHGTQDPCVSADTAFALGRNSGQENAIAFSCKDYGADAGPLSPTLLSMGHDGSHANVAGDHAPAVAYSTKLHNTGSNSAGKIFEERTTRLDASSLPPALLTAMQVRRLTPRECERLQGFPDDYTLIPWRKKPASECPDGPRYKALGNSWAVTKVRWIGRRIDRELRRATA